MRRGNNLYVFVVCDTNEEGESILGIYSTESSAKKRVKELVEDERNEFNDYTIYKWRIGSKEAESDVYYGHLWKENWINTL